MNNDELNKMDELLDEQLDQTDLESLRGGRNGYMVPSSSSQDGGNGSSDCCNGGW